MRFEITDDPDNNQQGIHDVYPVMGINNNEYQITPYGEPADDTGQAIVPEHEWLIINETALVDLKSRSQTDIPDAPYEHIANTKLGGAAIIGHDTSLSYDINDLITSLTSIDEYPYVHDAAHERLLTVPGRPDIILRHNTIKNLGLPNEFTTVAAHMLHYEHLLGKLKDSGIPLLRRSAFVVEQDPYDDNKPAVYTVAERTNGDALNDHNPKYTEISTELCSILTDHLTGPLDHHVINDLSCSAQYASDGRLLDYDPRVSNTVSFRRLDIHNLWLWVTALPNTPQTRSMFEKIREVVAEAAAIDPETKRTWR